MASSWHLLLPVLVLLAAAGPAASWWDAGHMLVAEVAKQYLQQTGDLSPLMKVLNRPDGISGYDKFRAFRDFADSAVWMDQLKCTSQTPPGPGSYCSLPSVPSMNLFTYYHYGGECLPVNGYPDSSNVCPQKDRLDSGLILEALSHILQSFLTTKSAEAAALHTRMLLHLLGDLHMPLHNGDGADRHFPSGDVGGNLRRFLLPCPVGNLHALWDSAGFTLTRSWDPETYAHDLKNITQAAKQLIANASALLPDSLLFASLDNTSSFSDAYARLTGKGGMLSSAHHAMAHYAQATAYSTDARRAAHLVLEPAPTSDPSKAQMLPCPAPAYFSLAAEASLGFIHLAGLRASHVLRAVSRQLVRAGVAAGDAAAGGQLGAAAALVTGGVGAGRMQALHRASGLLLAGDEETGVL